MMIGKIINPNATRQVIALSGPPGIGKTAICRAHEFASGIPLEFCNIGSCSDVEALKGSTSVWNGASAGILAKSMTRMGCNNGTIVLDEIDKINQGSHRSKGIYMTLLEVLDYSQNDKYEDQFLSEIPIDLSHVTFMLSLIHI